LKGITKADLQEQFDLAIKIRDKTTAANEAVIQIREVKQQMEERLEEVTDLEKQTSIKAILDRLSIVEEKLYQVRNRSNQDPLNFPIKLNNRLASLRRSVENGDAKPTAGAYQVFEELSKELEEHLKELEDILKDSKD